MKQKCTEGESRLWCSPNESFDRPLGTSEAGVALPGCLSWDESDLVFKPPCLSITGCELSWKGGVPAKAMHNSIPNVGDLSITSHYLLGGGGMPSFRMVKHGVRNGKLSLTVAIV